MAEFLAAPQEAVIGRLALADAKGAVEAEQLGAWPEEVEILRKALVYLLNAYRVLLTRARQGMIIFVPPGDHNDPTRLPRFYDGTFEYLTGLGVAAI